MLRRAFTLVELLVVIGIIAILVGVLLPALRTAREHALSVQCLSNLRQCGQLLYLYANQNKGFFPTMSLQSPETLTSGANVTGEMGVPVAGDPPLKTSNTRDALFRIANPGRIPPDPNNQAELTNVSPGGLLCFYCPANFFWDGDVAGQSPPAPAGSISHWPEDFMRSRGRIKYWYVGDPNPYYPRYHYQGTFSPIGQPPTSQGGATVGTLDWRFWDSNKSGDNRDDYFVKLGERNMARNVLMTDQSRQSQQGATTVGFQFVHGKSKTWINGWKNNLYGDGHAESRRARISSFSPDGKSFTNTNPSPDEIQPRWGNASGYQMW
jgi:prepilin-type N-terminal cleavage/methylation domain-containing protein